MNKRLKNKIQALLDGEDGARSALVEELRGAPVGMLLEAAAHESPLVRAAAAEVFGGRTEPGVIEAAVRLVQDADEAVREAIAKHLSNDPDWPLPDDAVRVLLGDANGDVRRLAASAAGAAFVETLRDLLAFDTEWEVRLAAAKALERCHPEDVLQQQLHSLGEDDDSDVQLACAAAAERALSALGRNPEPAERPGIQALRHARERMRDLGPRRFPALAAWLDDYVMHAFDLAELAAFGTVLRSEDVSRAHGADETCDAILETILGGGRRSVVLLGPHGCGKTAIVHELVHRLRDEGWVVLRATATDLMTGTRYIGEWETRITELMRAVRRPRKVLLYVPNVEELAMAGTHSKSDMNMAAALAPDIENGSVAILGESSVEGFRRGLAKVPALRSLFRTLEIRPANEEQTRVILERICADAGASTGFLDRLGELADLYSVGAAQPGRAVGLLRRVLESGADPTPRQVLETLSQSTGIPTDFLDDDVPLDLDALRAFFESRVMGQPEAIDAVIDLVALIKSGLTDPAKPYGVLFFVGPTGVGKTELARTLAEYLFGDPARVTRFDMSEYATYHAFERLIGAGSEEGLLTNTVREHPFSVLLLDEIEKAHVNIFDLCLQIFDAGRLTDTRGRTADFRRSIIILTSNVGSTVPTEDQLGFGGEAKRAPDHDSILRELRRFFRPEFLNRLDRIVSFRALAVETAQKIAERELAKVIERAGIARRRLAVDVDPQVLALLLKEGYSPAFGARPLKRTVERMVLMPLAHAIAAGRVKDGSVVRMRAAGGAVLVDLVESAEDEDAPRPVEPAALEEVRDAVANLRERAGDVEARKVELLERTHRPDFWDDQGRARATLDEVHRLDSLLHELARLEAGLKVTEENRDRKRAAYFLSQHEQQAKRLNFLFACDDLGDAVVTISLVNRQGATLDGVASLAGMYRQLARRRGLECEVLDERKGGVPSEHTVTMAIGGAGAFALLKHESGLHQLSRTTVNERRNVERSLVRVDVLRAPSDETPLSDVKVETRQLPDGRYEVNLLHVPSLTSVRAWCDREDALEKLHPVLRARVEQGTPSGDDHIVRRYRFGPQPFVRDRRTGRRTGRLDQVLNGEVDFCA